MSKQKSKNIVYKKIKNNRKALEELGKKIKRSQLSKQLFDRTDCFNPACFNVLVAFAECFRRLWVAQDYFRHFYFFKIRSVP